MKCVHITIELHITLNFLLQERLSATVLPGKLTRWTIGEVRITILFKSCGVKKINELVVTGKKLTNTFASLIISGLRLDVAAGRQLESAGLTTVSYV
jgi:hypothetical protein